MTCLSERERLAAMSEHTCDRDGCDKDSKFLLTCGDRCQEHAQEDQPETTEYLQWGAAVLGGDE